MPRIFSTAIKGELSKRLGTEPLVIIEIEWVRGTPIAYTDRKLNGSNYPNPFIHAIGNFDSATIVDGSGDSQNVSITLNDIDGSLREIISNNDIHLNPVRVYLGFQGLPLSEKALMFEGVINSPITWNEGARTLTFDVFSKLEDAEVGFTMEDGDFPFVPPADRNSAWPLVFGQVCNMKTVPVTSNRKGFLAVGQGVVDPTLTERICQANFLLCPNIVETTTTTNPVTGASETTEKETDEIDPNCLIRRFNEVCSLLTEQDQEQQFVNPSLVVRGGEGFPQGKEITIQIKDVKYKGIMNGEIFTITETFHPDLERINNPECQAINGATVGFRFRPAANKIPQTVQECEDGGTDFVEDIVDGSGASWDFYNEFESGSFIWLPAGSEVFLQEESEIVNIVSLIPGIVDQVAAYRTYGDTTLLSEVDPSRYTVVTTDFGGYEVVEIRLTSDLSLIPDEDWEDDIFVSFTSSIGPNPVDVIEWLVNKYTEYTIDSQSFASVHASLVNYPANFFLKDRRSVLQTVRDIAYQFRCAVFIRNNVVHLVYLSKEPDSLKTITKSDIVSNTFRFTHSSTEDLQTSHLVKWSETEAGINRDDPTDFEFVIKHQVPRYGTISVEQDYFTQNIFEPILKSATFWMIRRASTWRIVEFETPIQHLDLDIFDCVTLNIDIFPTTKIIITETNYNADTNTIQFKAWTPILSGTSVPYFWAWPALQDAGAVFPLIEQQDTIGDGTNNDVIPPIGHPLRGGFDPDASRIQTAGDQHPSDLDDTFPVVECKIATGAEIQDAVEPNIEPFEPVADKNFADGLKKQEGSGGGSSKRKKKEKRACGKPILSGGCVYEVKVLYITPDLVTAFPKDAPCKSQGPCRNPSTGLPCTGSQTVFCHTFGALFAASSFASAKQAEADALHAACAYNSNQTAVLDVIGFSIDSAIKGIPGDGPFGDCDTGSGGGGGGGGGGGPGAGYGNQTTEPGVDSSDSDAPPSPSDLVTDADICREDINRQIFSLNRDWQREADSPEPNDSVLNDIESQINSLINDLNNCV